MNGRLPNNQTTSLPLKGHIPVLTGHPLQAPSPPIAQTLNEISRKRTNSQMAKESSFLINGGLPSSALSLMTKDQVISRNAGNSLMRDPN